MEKIVSTKNERVKKWKKLQTKKGREKAGEYLIEGMHLVEEALENGAPVQEVIVIENRYEEKQIHFPAEKTVLVSEEIAAQLTDTETPQGIFAVIKLEKSPLPETVNHPFLFLDSVQDPGNVGTMIRTADAAGFGGVVLGKGTVDLYNSKVLRSMQGSHFHLPVYHGDLEQWISMFQEKGLPVYGTELNEDAVPYHTIPSSDVFAVIMGNEGNGMQQTLLKKTDKNLYIPILGKAESLNVAVAAGILMFALTQPKS